ncbi:MAG: GCN5-related N-acetyltransferase [candidate division CPR3 bacterium GW2011_GWE2_35_7]|nr:MAG: GCN5-related N-acetyltransferase [candidate division CPR3 bacterium GW2011_GWE2_35_7]
MEFGKLIKQFVSKSGKEITLQVVEDNDLQLLLDFINRLIQEDTYIYRETDSPVTLDEERLWLSKTLEDIARNDQFYFVAKADNKIVGVGNIVRGWMREREQGTFRMSIDKNYRDQGLGAEMTQVAIDSAKNMGLRILKAWIFADDEKAVYLAKKMNFIEAGRLPQSIYFKEKYIDEILFFRKLEDIYIPEYGGMKDSETGDENEDIV